MTRRVIAEQKVLWRDIFLFTPCISNACNSVDIVCLRVTTLDRQNLNFGMPVKWKDYRSKVKVTRSKMTHLVFQWDVMCQFLQQSMKHRNMTLRPFMKAYSKRIPFIHRVTYLQWCDSCWFGVLNKHSEKVCTHIVPCSTPGVLLLQTVPFFQRVTLFSSAPGLDLGFSGEHMWHWTILEV